MTNPFMMRGLALLLTICCLSSCYEPTEGCLDVRATNFDLDADNACADCCTFPDLKVEFDHVWVYADTTLNLDLDTFYLDGQGQAFRIEQIRYYWSNVELQLSGGGLITPSDSITFDIQQSGDTSSITVADNFLLASGGSANTSHTIGSIEPEGIISGLTATFGIDDPANQALEGSTSLSGHPLGPQLGGMNLGTDLGYVFAKLELYPDTAVTTDTLVLHLYGTDLLQPIQLDVDPSVMLFDGVDPVVVIETNYAHWFEGVDIRQSDTTAIKSQIVNNLTQSFRVLEVRSD